MVRRSVLFSPGDRPEMLRKAPETGADVVVFDLEDAVAPARKAEAREAVADVLTSGFDPDPEVCVRVTANDAAADLDALLDATPDSPRPDALVLPKVEAEGDVRKLAEQATERPLRPRPLAARAHRVGDCPAWRRGGHRDPRPHRWR